MPPQGYYGKARTPARRKQPPRTVVRSGPPKGRPGSGMKRPTRPPVYQPPSAPPSAGTVNTQLNTAANAGLTGGMGGYDINSDPAVAAAQGLAAKMRATAQAAALAKRKQAAIEYGDPSGVEGIDETTQKAARENPFSVLKNLEHAYTTGTADLEEGLNKANLFYSGYRGKQLGEASRGYQDSRYQAASRFKALNTDISEQLANALLNADMYEAQSIMGSDGGSYGYGGDGGGSSYRVPYDPGRSLAGALGGLGSSGAPRTPVKPKSAPRLSYSSLIGLVR